jgi:hypothetical protein
MKIKVLKSLSMLVIFLTLLSVYGWMVSKVSNDSMQIGFFTKPLKHLYQFPDLFTKSVEEVKSLPRTFKPIEHGFEPVNKLKDDVIVLATYTNESNSRSIIALNLKTDSVLYKWTIEDSFQQHDRILNPLLFPEKSLVYAILRKGIKRIDSLSNVLWQQDSIKQHHSMNRDADGKIWICSYENGINGIGYYKQNGGEVFFIDNFITQLDDKTGRILFHKSVAEILKENQLSYYLIKSAVIRDPLHLNDVQPALKTTHFYNQGDVFINLRNLSMILHYRPSTNQLVNLIQGPFSSQHDVDILDDSTLVVFNNNSFQNMQQQFMKGYDINKISDISGDFYSNIVSYNFADSSFTILDEEIFRENKIFSHSESLVEYITPDTYFIEEQNQGVLWIISDGEVVYKNGLKSHHEGYFHLPNWSRIISSWPSSN